MEAIPEEHPMMQFTLRFLLAYSLTEPQKRIDVVQGFVSSIVEREQKLSADIERLKEKIEDYEGSSDYLPSREPRF